MTIGEAGPLVTGEWLAARMRIEAPLDQLGDRDDSLIATAAEVLAWSREASAQGGPTRLLDVRRIDEFLGRDVMAARAGHIPGARHPGLPQLVGPGRGVRPPAAHPSG